MNRRILLASIIFTLCFVSPRVEAAEPSITGKWATDAAVALKKWRDKRDESIPAERGLFNVDSGLRGGRGARGGRGGALGGGGGALGGRGGNDFAQRAGARGARGAGGFGGQGAPLGGQPAIAAVPNIPPPELPDGPPISMELKVDKNKMTGTVVVSMDLDKDEKFKVEDGKVEGKTFTFTTLRKSGSIQIPTGWKGELRSDNVISVVRALPSGAAADDEPFPLRRQK